MSNITMTVKSNHGSTASKTAEDAQDLADRLGVRVKVETGQHGSAFFEPRELQARLNQRGRALRNIHKIVDTDRLDQAQKLNRITAELEGIL